MWLLFVLTVTVTFVRCDYGGHDLFTSLSQLEQLWINERKVVEKMETAIQEINKISQTLQRYVDSHRSISLDQEPNFDYLGHPLNGYHLIKHVALGWGDVRDVAFKAENQTRQIFDDLREREKLKLPDVYDVTGAAFGLARLHSLYEIDTDEMIQNGVIKTNIKNGFKAHSKPSVKKLGAWDLEMLAVESGRQGLLNTQTDVYPHLLNKLNEEEDQIEAKVLELFSAPYPNRTKIEHEAKIAFKMHDQVLIKRGSRGNAGSYRTHNSPFDPALQKTKKGKKKKFRDPTKNLDPIRDELEVERSRKEERAETHFKSEVQKELLCSGRSFRDPKEDADLRCFYGHNDSPWLRLGPMKIEVKNKDPYLVILRELMFPHECDNITKFLGPHLDFPPGRMSSRGGGQNDWTMKNAWPIEDDNLYLEKMTRRVEHVTNLLASSSKRQSDAFMCGNYGIGGHYGIHPDFSTYDQHKFLHTVNETVNRIATVMCVLEEPQAGGATVWPFLGVSIFPEKGSAAMWFNLRSDGYPDYLTLHAACPVLLGQKWIGNKWIGYTPQYETRPCSLTEGVKMQGPLPIT